MSGALQLEHPVVAGSAQFVSDSDAASAGAAAVADFAVAAAAADVASVWVDMQSLAVAAPSNQIACTLSRSSACWCFLD